MADTTVIRTARCGHDYQAPGPRGRARHACDDCLTLGCPGCGKPSAANGLCSSCVYRALPDDACGACGKPRKIQARGMCSACYASAWRAANPVEGTCALCAATFGGRKGQQFCTLRCQRLAALGIDHDRPAKKRAHKSQFRRKAERVAKKAAAGTTGGNLVWVQGACCMCGCAFVSPGSQSRYCSRSCRARNRLRTHGLSMLERVAIFERDQWVCQICSEPVDWTAHHRSDWYPTLDHIIPRSKGGGHESDNLRTAHRWCNSVRGDATFYTDADLRA